MNIMRNYPAIGFLILCLSGLLLKTYACSSICLNKKGQLILGNNTDWITGSGMVVVNKRYVKKHGFWYENKPDWTWISRYGSISFNMEGREFPIRGMNEAGLAIVEMSLKETVHPSAEGRAMLCGSQWIQYQLDNSATVEDVISSDTVVRIEPTDWAIMGSHYLVCDTSGTVAGIEWIGGKMIVYKGNSLPIPAMVNSTYESCISSGDDPSGRFKPIADMYAGYDTAKTTDGLSYVFSMLETVKQYAPLSQTQWSIAYDMHSMRCYWKTMANDKLRYCNLKDFDFSCKTDVEVLDINSTDTGNVRGAFTPYTTAFDSAMVTQIYNLYNQYSYLTGVQYSQDTIDGIINFPTSTVCTDGFNGIIQTPHPDQAKEIGKCRMFFDCNTKIVRIVFPVSVTDCIELSMIDTRGRSIVPPVKLPADHSQTSFNWRVPMDVAKGVYLCRITDGKKLNSQTIIIRR